MQKPSLKLICDKRSVSKRHGNKHPVKLVVTFRLSTNKWRQVYYGTNYYMLPKEFDRIMKNPTTVEDKLVRASIQKHQDKAFNIIETKKDLTPDSFERYFMGSRISSIEGYFELSIQRMNDAGRLGTIRINAIKSFKKFDSRLNYFSDITEAWLDNYSNWMLTPRVENEKIIKARTLNTVAINLTELKTVFNEAIKDGTIDREMYPFNDFKIKRETRFKIPLAPEEVARLKEYKTDNSFHRRAVDFWLISYYCFGINIGDLLSMKFSDIKRGFLVYDRQKTRGTKSSVKMIEIPLRDELQALIDRYKRPSLNPDDYIFPVRELSMSNAEFHYAKKNFIKSLDQSLRWVAKKLAIEKLNTNLARHTAANTLINSGYSKEIIQYLLGHTDMRTTEIYSGTIIHETLKKASGSL